MIPPTDSSDPPSGPYRVGIAGGSGYGGAETLRWVALHPRLEVCGLTSRTHAGKPVPAVHPNLAGFADDVTFVEGPEALLATGPDVVVMALPHRHAAAYAHALREIFPELRIVDLSGDHRLGSSEQYRAAYKADHPHPDELESGRWVYGLPEANRDLISNARVLANPGCFATGALLGALPLCRRGLVVGPVRHVAITGSSGSGADPTPTTHHPERTGDVKAYKVLHHQHVPEIERCLGGVGLPPETPWMMVPQSGPFARGIFTTLFFELRADVPADELRAVFAEEYADAPFVRIREGTPRIGHVRGTNFCDVSVTARGRHAVVLTAIDNLGKGMAGQAVQNVNLMLGLPETLGLMVPGSRP